MEDQDFKIDQLEEEAEEDKRITTRPSATNSSKLILMWYFVSAGLVSLIGYFVMIAQSEQFEKFFPNQNYTFFIVLPQYLSIPISLTLSKVLQHIPLHTKISSLIPTTFFLYLLIPLLPFFVLPMLSSMLASEQLAITVTFWLLILTYTMAYSCGQLLQSDFLASCQLFPPKYTVVFFTCLSLSNVILMIVKLALVEIEAQQALDFISMWTIMAIAYVSAGTAWRQVMKVKEVKRLDKKEDSRKDIKGKGAKEIKLWETGKVIGPELVQVFLTMLVTFVVFPGVIFGLPPVSIFSKKQYVSITNFLIAIIDVVGRPIGGYKFNRFLTKVFLVLGIVADIFLVTSYLLDWNAKYEGLCYTFMILALFLIFRTATSTTYLLVTAGGKANEENQEAIGIMMMNTLIFGIAVGNMISIPLPFIKNLYL